MLDYKVKVKGVLKLRPEDEIFLIKLSEDCIFMYPDVLTNSTKDYFLYINERTSKDEFLVTKDPNYSVEVRPGDYLEKAFPEVPEN